MADTVNARIPPGVRQKLAEYCAKQGVTRSEVVIRARRDPRLDRYPGAGGRRLECLCPRRRF